MDYHFLYLAPNLGAEWLFDAARHYWERFQPTVLGDLSFLQFIPPADRVIVTVIALRDTVSTIGVNIAQQRPDAQIDYVVYESFEQAQLALDGRASANAPFGASFAPTQPAGGQVQPTPGSVLGGAPAPTRPPSGFITQTPTPTPAPTLPAPDLPAAADADDPAATRAPITPTPGSLIINGG